MKKILFLFIIFFSTLGCKSISIEEHNFVKLNFLDEYILSENVMINGAIVGGLSGIDYHNGIYYIVSDDAYDPRLYEATIDIQHKKIADISIRKEIKVIDAINYLDLESIRYGSNNEILLTSEGHITAKKDPLFFSLDTLGNVKKNYKLPEYIKSSSIQKPRHNGTLEGLTTSFDKKGFWIAMELPLEADGEEPALVITNSPVRITYIDKESNLPIKAFAYKLDMIAKIPKGNFAVNGLTDILMYEKDKFYVVERSYSSGLGNQGNTVKIFNVDASKATNILDFDSLKSGSYIPAKKELLFDFETIRDSLTDKSIDNIEGLTFGPILPNKNKTLLLVADNNFNQLGPQLNQFILLEIVDQNSK